MAHPADPRSRQWIAFLAGAVAMLALVMIWLAWSRLHDAAGTLRAEVALPSADLPSLPTNPPPEGPHPPRLPLPGPR